MTNRLRSGVVSLRVRPIADGASPLHSPHGRSRPGGSQYLSFAPMTTLSPVYSRRAFRIGALRIDASDSPRQGEAQVRT